MIKYTTTEVVFREVPDEVTLAINISNCPIRCPDCHSKELWEDIGTKLTQVELDKLISENNGITCVAFMGGDSDPEHIEILSKAIKEHYPELKVAWYSGRDLKDIKTSNLRYLDYIKTGPYIKGFPLDNSNTNQEFNKITKVKEDEEGNLRVFLAYMGDKFLNKESE